MRDYYAKYTKTDRLDSRMLARLPLLHPEGLEPLEGLGPAESFKRAVRRRGGLVQRRQSCCQRLDAMVEMLGPAYAEALGTGAYSETAPVVLERYGDPRALGHLGRRRLASVLRRPSRGHWREAKADELLAAADETMKLWAAGGLDFAALAADIAAEVRVVHALGEEISRLDARVEDLYRQADPEGIVLSAPGLGVTLSAAILGRFGDFDRFANPAGVRSFTGLVPKVDGNTNGHGARPRPVTQACVWCCSWPPTTPDEQTPNLRSSTPVLSSKRASTTTLLFATSPPRSLQGSQHAGGPKRLTPCATWTAS